MNILEFIKERISKNYLDINPDECYDIIKKYENIYPNESEIKRFFYYILNKVGSIIIPIHEEHAEILGFLKVRGKGDITFFEFEDEEDYYIWLQVRIILYEKISDINQLRLLNYLELSTMNFITDINTICKYQLIDNNNNITFFEKTGFGTNMDNLSFIKYLGTKFKEEYTFKPIK